MMMEIGWQGAGSGSQQREGGQFLINKQKDEKTVKMRRGIGAAERKKGDRRRRRRSRSRSRSISCHQVGRWEESEKEKGDRRPLVERKKRFKEKEKEVEVNFLSPGREMGRKRRGEGRLASVGREKKGIQENKGSMIRQGE